MKFRNCQIIFPTQLSQIIVKSSCFEQKWFNSAYKSDLGSSIELFLRSTHHFVKLILDSKIKVAHLISRIPDFLKHFFSQ